jgi:cytochrome c553
MKKIFIVSLISSVSFAYTNCAMCHTSSYYPLNKLTPKEISDKLYAFKKGYGTMARIAKTMSDKDIKEVAKKYGRE